MRLLVIEDETALREQLCSQLPEPAVVNILAQWLPPADTDTPKEKETKKHSPRNKEKDLQKREILHHNIKNPPLNIYTS